MKKLNALVLLGALAVLAACVTINVYFPAAAAERAAEEFVGDVLGEPREDSYRVDPMAAPTPIMRLAGGLLDLVVPSAMAQEPEIDINTPQINAIKARMAGRQRQQLDGWFDAGAIGFTADGLIEIRDRAAVPLSDRRMLEAVVADENRDRRAVYREIAVANGHPEWEADIQEIFAREWVQKARSGWYYQDASGRWLQK
jgi:uncharacterized protein YdbL (DUF1318 family)